MGIKDYLPDFKGALTGFYEESLKATIETKTQEFKDLLQKNIAYGQKTQRALVAIALEIIDIQPLISARNLLKNIIKDAENEYEYMGASYSPRDVFRKAYLTGLINNFDTWVSYLDTRNLTVHTYNEDVLYEILSKYPYQFYAYGSRAKGTARRISDLDICYYDNIPSSVICEMREEFTESNLPFEVELQTKLVGLFLEKDVDFRTIGSDLASQYDAENMPDTDYLAQEITY
ncbi:7370_t:CDS:2 [Entrophospora sp. SA101]|nr:7370_t:CDS:2 [Entrophospora sp. SA101]